MGTEANLSSLPIILRESRARLILFLLLMIALIILGLFLMNGGDFWIGFGAVIFGSATAIALIAQLRSDRVRSLRIDSAGLTWRLFACSAPTGWNASAGFVCARIP